MMDSTEIFDVKNLSSRKLYKLAITGSHPELQQLAEQELSFRRHQLERLGRVYRGNDSIHQQLYRQ